MNRRAVVALACLALVLAPGAARPQAPSHWTIGMSQCNLGEPWRVQMNADIRKAAEAHPELTVIFKEDKARASSHHSPGAGCAAGKRRRAATPTRQRRSSKLNTPPNAMITAPIQIHGTSGFQ